MGRTAHVQILSVAIGLLLSCTSVGTPEAGLVSPSLANLGAPSGLREQLLFVPGHTPPDNPHYGVATPPEYNGSRVLEIRSTELTQARIVVVGIPGFFAGINNWKTVGEELVRRDPQATVVWAYERRGNNMEDLTGVNYAEATGDLQAALDYYFEGRAIDGRTFDGFLEGRDLRYQSEWGLGTHFRDIRAVIELARTTYPDAAVVWMGHSMGSFWGEVFPAFQFECTADGMTGQDLLDGLILVDGTITEGIAADLSTYTESDFLDGASLRVAGVTTEGFGLSQLRRGNEFFSDLGAGQILLGLELAALAARFDPEREMATYLSERLFTFDYAFQVVHGLHPQAAGLATLGLLFDDDTQPLSFARAHFGRPQGNYLMEHANPLNLLSGDDLLGDRKPGPLLSPTRSGETISWDAGLEFGPEAPIATADEIMDLFYAGPSNFLEWYYPVRLLLDLNIAAGAAFGHGAQPQWVRAYDLCFSAPSDVRLPTLVVAAQLGVVPAADDYDRWLQGTSIADLEKLDLTGHNHADMLAARNPQKNPLLDTVSRWLRSRY